LLFWMESEMNHTTSRATIREISRINMNVFILDGNFFVL